MNVPIVRLYGLIVLLFALLVGFTSRWTVFDADALRNNPKNRRGLLEEARIKRGVIRSADGKVLARSVRTGGSDSTTTYGRRYPTGSVFAHAVGYSFTDITRSGLERSRNDELTGRETELVTVFESLLGREREGNDITTTLNYDAQQVALRALAGRKGSVVALDANTGAVLVMANSPSYDPNGLDRPGRFRALATDTANSPLLNRATQGGYQPGSTFKVVTAAAALDSGRFNPSSTVNGDSPKTISGVPLENFGDEDFGDTDLTNALTHSVNTVWAQVGERLGKRRLADYMQRFGFYSKPELDYPRDQMLVSGEYGRSDPLSPTSGRIDVGRMAIGQDKLRVTPLQMAMVAQTVANGGVRMKPYLTSRVIDPDGRTVDHPEPERADRVMSAATARELGQMMENVVREGTGTAAALEGVKVAGKTGTAEIDIARRINQPWFIGFSGGVAVAATVERVQGGQGGTVAAPIAKQVLQKLGQ
jgi:peptidoglycan glycosyltransferase